MKKRYVLVFLILFLINLASADIGRHSSIRVDINKDGRPIYESALVCYNTFIPGGTQVFENRTKYIDFNDSWISYEPEDYLYLKEAIEGKRYISCFYCNEISNKKPCETWFYTAPTQIAVLYPAYEKSDSSEKNIKPVLYETGIFDLSKRNLYDYRYEAELKRDGTILLRNKTPIFSLKTLITFLIALGLVALIEFFYIKKYLLKKKGNYPNRLLIMVLFMNVLSLSVLWFVFPIFLKDIILILILGEIFVVLFEGVLIYQYKRDEEIEVKEALKVSFIANLLSFLIGGVVLRIILEVFSLFGF